MLRQRQQFHASLLWLFDIGVVLLSFAIAYRLRFFWTAFIPTPWGVSPVEETQALVVSIALIWALVLRFSGLYTPRRELRLLDELYLVAKATVVGVLCLVASFYFLREVRYSRLTIGLFAVVSALLLTLSHALFRSVMVGLRRRGFRVRRALVVGTGELAAELIKRLHEHPQLGIQVLGCLAKDDEEPPAQVAGVPIIGRYGDVEKVVRERGVLQVYIALPLDQHRRFEQVLGALDEEMVDIKVVPDLVQYYTLRGGIEELWGLPLVHLQGGPALGWDAVAKRSFDLLVAALLLILIAPIMLVTALLVKVTSPGPVFYGQERMGLDGRLFRMLKFRSMRTDAERQGAKWASAGDDRTTPVGKWLRKFSIDELPQFINVLRGEMSLVGPRPERPVFIAQFKKQIPRYNLRHKVKAGITGLAQVEGWRGQTSLEKRIERDLYYIEHWSLWLDVKILVRTALGGFLSRNAY